MGELDVTAMYGMHEALRWEVTRLARLTVQVGHDPRRVLRWRLFKQSLRCHFAAEDEALWPPLRRAMAHRPEALTLLEAVEAEHAALDELIDAIDEAPTHADARPGGLGDLTDSLVTGLTGHLRHEEAAVLPLIRQALTPPQWAYFTHLHIRRSTPP
ncbi:hemerythrin domain-containing protein [Nonomuraea sp. B19D2]|uniref:hemerythrin domain-containing protein n=1 Tax=Nonomuraea sp. B19D2 TaxID=3159561 RepID=UPI0032DB7A85